MWRYCSPFHKLVCIFNFLIENLFKCTSQTGFKNTVPLVYFHGYTNPKDNIELYKTLISNLASKINDRLARDEDARSSGIIVNTTGWIDGEGFTLLMHAIQTLGIDVVLVMGHDKLYSNLITALDGTAKAATVVKLPRSGGVVSRVSPHCLFFHSFSYCNSCLQD